MGTPITGSLLYSYVRCPHRVTADTFYDPRERLEESAFIQLLWESGTAFEKTTISNLAVPFSDLSMLQGEEKVRATISAMDSKVPLIYSGRIVSEDLVGEPDLLRLDETGYVPIDIKSGAGEEGASESSEGKPKKHYAVQLGLYLDVLNRQGRSSGRIAYVWDINGKEAEYDFGKPLGPKTSSTLWDFYLGSLSEVRGILARTNITSPALGSSCKLCPWRKLCRNELIATDDLSLIFELGRSKRDTLYAEIPSVSALAEIHVANFVKGKKTNFPGIGPDSLLKFKRRAKLLKSANPKPYLKERLSLPTNQIEIFYDVETDPMRDVCYLHGIIERRNNDRENQKYISFLAADPTQEAEARAFSEVWHYFKSLGQHSLYYYSSYERTTLRRLQKKFPHVVTAQEVESLFNSEHAVDLYFGIVHPKSEWPTSDYSIKTLATLLDFSWRDSHPSGAASIEWYHQWIETNDPEIKRRLLEYNEDDCVATAVLLDGLRMLEVIDPELEAA